MNAPQPDSAALGAFFAALLGPAPAQAAAHVQQAFQRDDPLAPAMLRLTALQPGLGMMDCYRLNNLYDNASRPGLKPNAVDKRVLLLTDTTADGYLPLLRLFCAARGVRAEVQLPLFDSVEQDALNPDSPIYTSLAEIVVLMLSGHWLARYIGRDALVSRADVQRAGDMLAGVIDAIAGRSGATVLVCTFGPEPWPAPGSLVATDALLGRSAATQAINDRLAELAGDGVYLVDTAGALHGAAPAAALGTVSYLRAKIAHEPDGVIAICRELAAGVAAVCGKSARAIVTDWDNTLWGGEVAELGPLGVECGVEHPDGLGYHLVQQTLKGLRPLGVALAGASRNPPAVTSVLTENPDVVLKPDDFAALEVSFAPKSESIRRISEDLGFGPEYMVFLDDSPFELAEALAAHPGLDVIQAGPSPDQTLERLASARLGQTLAVTEADLARSERMGQLRKQRAARASFDNLPEFLRSIDIRLTVSPITEANRRRVLQMFAKTNQFNLTTRRHDQAALEALAEAGATIASFSYEDSFGPQGVIAVVVLIPAGDALEIESWLMSCRVLNRTVEQAIFDWVRRQAAGRAILGRFVPTERNALVADLYPRLGFRTVSNCESEPLWRYDPAEAADPPEHFVTILEPSEDATT